MRLWRSGSSQLSCHNQTDQLPRSGSLHAFAGLSAAGHIIVERIRRPCWQSVRDVAHDRNDFLHDIAASAAGSTSQQILDRSADLRFCIVLIYKIPIELIWHGNASGALRACRLDPGDSQIESCANRITQKAEPEMPVKTNRAV